MGKYWTTLAVGDEKVGAEGILLIFLDYGLFWLLTKLLAGFYKHGRKWNLEVLFIFFVKKIHHTIFDEILSDTYYFASHFL